MPVFFLPDDQITPPMATVTGELVAHLRDSLRVGVGEELLLGDGNGHRYRAAVTAISKQAITARILERLEEPPSSAPSLTLGLALLKGDKMDWAIQKTTELGVAAIVPLQTRHSVVQPKRERIEAQRARWQRIALEAAQQSEQWRVPQVRTPQALGAFLAEDARGSLRLILAERQSGAQRLLELDSPLSPEATLTVLVGPEGGWTREEVAQAAQAGYVPITLGPQILRAETAAIIALGLLQHRLGRLG